MNIVREKIDQALGILNELGIDVWMLMVRETAEMADPSFKLIAPAHVVWPSAFIFCRNGRSVAIVGRYDAEIFRRSGLYSEVIGYDEGLSQDVRRIIGQVDPRQIALDYSTSSHAADGISYGMYLTLKAALDGTPYAGHLVSAEELVARLRGRKSPSEVALIRGAVELTESMFARLGREMKPGRSERDVAALLGRWMQAAGVEPAWDPQGCPMINAGANADSGHAGPTETKIERGQVIHIDFGVRREGFCSDLQRMWYLRRPGERQAPQSVQRAFAAVRRTIEAGAEALKPGATGWQVDDAGRSVLLAAGYPEFKHALGHQLGRTAHDGSTILGPRWERYGTTPSGVIEAGQVFTLELSAQTEAGMVGLEENVLVTEHGCEYLSTPQTEVWYV